MRKTEKNIVQVVPVRSFERKHILDSMVASFRIEGIFIPEIRVEAIYARVAERLIQEDGVIVRSKKLIR